MVMEQPVLVVPLASLQLQEALDLLTVTPVPKPMLNMLLHPDKQLQHADVRPDIMVMEQHVLLVPLAKLQLQEVLHKVIVQHLAVVK